MEQVELIAGSKSKAVKIAEDPDKYHTNSPRRKLYTAYSVQNILYDVCTLLVDVENGQDACDGFPHNTSATETI